MMHKKTTSVTDNKLYFICVLFSILSIAVGFITLADQNKGIYIYFPIVAFAYAIINLLFFDIYRNTTWVTMIVVAFMFLRYCVSLYILHIENYPRGIYTLTIDRERSLLVSFVMIYEIICIYIGLYLGKKKYHIQSDEEAYRQSLLSNYNLSNLNVVLIISIVFTIALFCIYPSLFNNYSFIVNSELDKMTGNIISSQAGLPSGMRWVGYTLGEVCRYIVLEFCILGLYKRYIKAGEKSSVYWWISVVITVVNASFTTQRLMIGVFMSLVFFYQIYQLYPKKRKFFTSLGVIVGSFGLLFITLTYWANTLKYQSFSQMIQGYTNGYYNVYQAYSAYDNADIGFWRRVEMFIIGDGLGNVNLLSMFINGTNSSNIYNFYIYGREFNGGAVLPLVAQMSFYFSSIIGPMVSFFVVLIAKKIEMKALSGQKNVLISQFCAFSLAATPFMYNYSTLIHILTVVALPLWGFCWINSKRIVVGDFKGI